MIPQTLRAIVLPGAVLVGAAFLVARADDRTAAAAQEFCRNVVLGTDIDRLRLLVSREEGARLQGVGSEVEVVFKGWVRSAQCSIVLENDRVSRTFFGKAD